MILFLFDFVQLLLGAYEGLFSCIFQWSLDVVWHGKVLATNMHTYICKYVVYNFMSAV